MTVDTVDINPDGYRIESTLSLLCTSVRHPSVCTFRSVGLSIEVLVFPMSAPLWRTGLLSISLFADTYTTVHQLAYLSRLVLYYPIRRPSRPTYGDLCCFSIGRFICRSLSTGLSVEACIVLFYSLPVAPPPWRLCTAPSISQPLRGDFSTLSIRQPLRRDFLLHFLSVETLRCTLLVGPAVEALHFISWSLRGGLYCTFYQSAPRRRGFVLLSLSVGPAAEALYCTLHQSAPPWRLCTVLSFLSVGPSVEALYCTLYLYQSAPPWRLCTVLYTSRPLRGGFVLHFKSVGPSVEALYCISSR
jgi:hypothetical protein